MFAAKVRLSWGIDVVGGLNLPHALRLCALAFTRFRWLWPPAAALLVCLALLVPHAARAQAACPDAAVGRLVAAEGPVDLERDSLVRPVALDDVLCPGDIIRVGPRGRAAVALADGGLLRLDQNTICRVDEGPTRRSLLDLFVGALHFLSRRVQALEVGTPFVNAAIEGTEFVLAVTPDRARLAVYEGRVRFENPLGRLLVESGQGAEALAGQPPVLRIVVRPRDAVQWALHYPAVLTPPVAPPELVPATEAAARGDLRVAFARLDEVPEAAQDAEYHVLRAGLLLAVGRADEARADIERVLALEPEAAEALALRAVIALAEDDKARALADARRATAADPDSAAAALALSYALQARFELEEARRVLRAAAARDPDDALVRARLAELELAFGETGRARSEAEAAAALAPELGRAQAVLGFVALAEIDIGAAEEAFEGAIALQPQDPLAHLGLGLALIRRSKLEAGREAIEVAAGLDPGNALIRSYLGKAYFEETHDEAAAEAFATAKELDPLGPTPFFYDAIRKQLQNRPVEALGDLETAIALNDNRAVYRSRLLLDQDLAVRSARLGRIYRDLGFEQLALAEGWKSVSRDPTNYSAHRLLADSYLALPRHEIARDSELLQSQLFQPININPVQPRLAADRLTILNETGPSDVSLSEFTRLFAADQVRLRADGVIGSHNTFADDIILSGIHRNLSYSLGQFFYTTDGIRENHDLKQQIYNAFVQAALSHRFSVQGEFRFNKAESGARLLLFDPENFFEDERRDFRAWTARAGLRYAFAPNSTLITSLMYRDQDEEAAQGPDGLRVRAQEDAIFAEARHDLQLRWLDLTVGAGRFAGEVEELIAVGPTVLETGTFDIAHTNAYAYGRINYRHDLSVTVGASVDLLDEILIERRQVNPKLGLIWRLPTDTTLRAAAFRVVKRTLTTSQTIEPTHVAGFNQFFDDVSATSAWRYGIALDQKVAPGLYVGAEFAQRDLEVPTRLVGAPERIEDIDERERFARAYLYAAPAAWIALSAEYRYERFDLDRLGRNPAGTVELVTHKVPLSARLFHPSGLFTGLTATYVDQDIRYFDRDGNLVADEDSFWTFDASLGYRFPNRRGFVSLDIKNLFDQDFKFQASDPADPVIVPERTILGRLTLAF